MKKQQKRVIWGTVICGGIMALSGCCKEAVVSREVPVEVKTIHSAMDLRTLSRVDSLYVHDSIYIREKGDTIWLEKWHTRDRVVLHRDTIICEVHDTIPSIVTLEKEIIKEKGDWKGWRLIAGVLFCLLLSMVLIFPKILKR